MNGSKLCAVLPRSTSEGLWLISAKLQDVLESFEGMHDALRIAK